MSPVTGPYQRGRLLVASPALVDPNFARTVILMLEHGDEGALGLVLNRPTDTTVADTLPTLKELAAPPAVIHVGGPVSPTAAICLGHLRPGASGGEGVEPLFDGLASVDVDAQPELLAAELDGVRVFAGYAGWGAGQLEGELEQGGWIVVDSAAGDVFDTRPDGLWRAVLRRQRPALAMLANFPEDLSLN
ncbi:MAG TPA: YqgE/AlgH family protein [Acidimicrobiales bacterium]|nr:YqgE/AlgH family protein [Acidimicrobiales bacterium]